MNTSQGFLNFVQINGNRCPRREMFSNITKQFLTGPMMEMSQAIGCFQTPIQKNVIALSDRFLAYICGKHIIIHKHGQAKQIIIVKNIQDNRPSHFIGIQKKNQNDFLFALALDIQQTADGFIPEAPPIVRIYQSQSQISFSQIHTHVDFHKGAVIKDMAFIKGGKKLITITGSIDKMFISYWDAKQKQQVFSGEFEIKAWRIMGFSTAQDQMFTYDENQIYIFEFTHQILMVDTISFTNKIQQEKILIAVKLKGRPHSALLTTNSKLLILRGWEVDEVYDMLEPTRQPPAKARACNVISYSVGFIVGYEMWARLDVLFIDSHTEHPSFKYVIDLKVAEFIRCTSLDMSADEGLLSVCFENSATTPQNPMDQEDKSDHDVRDSNSSNLNVVVVDFNSIVSSNQQEDWYNFIQPISILDKIAQPQLVDMFEQTAHRDSIIAIAQSLQSGRIMTLCQERQLRIWTTNSIKQLVFHNSFQLMHTPKCMDAHPTSFQIVIGSSENLSVYVVTDELKLYFSAPLKHCTQVRYSKLGEYLAVTCNSKFLLILKVWDLSINWTLECSHSVVDLQWAYNSTCVIVLTSDNEFMCYSIIRGCVVFQNQPKVGGKVVSIIIMKRLHVFVMMIYMSRWLHVQIEVYCISTRIRVITIQLQYKVQKLSYQMQIYNQCVYVKAIIQNDFDAIFFLTSIGSVRAYLWPFTNLIPPQQDFIELAMHQSRGSSLIISNKGVIVVGGGDGAIMVANIELYDRGSPLIVPIRVSLTQSLLLCYRPYREEVIFNLRDLKYRIDNYQTLQKQNQDTHIKRLKQNEDKVDLDKLANRTEIEYELNQVNEINTIQSKLLEIKLIQFRQEHHKQIESIGLNSQLSLNKLWDRNSQLVAEMLLENQEYSKQLDSISAHYQEEFNVIHSRGEKEVNAQIQQFIKESEQFEVQELQSAQLMGQTKVDHTLSVQNKVNQYQNALKKEQELNEELAVQESRVKQDCDYISRRIRELNTMTEYSTQMVGLDSERLLIYIEQSADAQMKLQDIEEQLNSKEMQIRHFNSYNQKLRLHKKVLDYQNEEFMREIGELKAQLKKLEDGQTRMVEKLVKEAQNSIQTQSESDKITVLIESKKLKLKEKRDINYYKKKRIERIEFAITLAIKETQPKQFSQAISKVFDQYFGKKISNQNIDQYIQEQGALLQKTVQSNQLTSTRNLQSQVVLNSIHHNTEGIRNSKQKAKVYHSHFNRLLEECNELKRENHSLIRQAEDQLAELAEINDEIKAFGGRLLQPVQVRSTSPRVRSARSASPIAIIEAEPVSYEALTPYQQIEFKRELIKLNLNQQTQQVPPPRQYIQMLEQQQKKGPIIRIGSNAHPIFRQRSLSPEAFMPTIQEKVRIIKFSNPVLLQRRSPSPNEKLEIIIRQEQKNKLIGKFKRSQSPL